MSTLLNFTASGTFGPSNGFRMGGITLSAGTANASATITDGGKQVMQLTAPANQTIPHSMTDWENGAVFTGQPSIATLAGNGASINIEEM